MNVATIKMEKYEARAKAREYAEAIRAGKGIEGDEDLLAAFRAIERGKLLIDLWETMGRAGVDVLHRPHLAIARADATECILRHTTVGYVSVVRFGSYGGGVKLDTNWDERAKRQRTDIPRSLWPVVTQKEHRAMVPSIPPHCRPKRPLENYWILWEAVWDPRPPRDPMLLTQVTRTIYAVIAQWDLTPLEMAVLRAGRIS